ncbi:MAG: hypothetical protein ACRD4Y_00180 [Candidatus Acidiferrales bacterium]
MTNAQKKNLAMLIVVAVVLLVWLVRHEFPSFVNHPTAVSESVQQHMGPADIYPDPSRTPGATNPEITQDNIGDTICNPRWSTRSVRPEASYTHRLKVHQMDEYGYADSRVRDYEEDHFIPLELGGNPTDPKNLWPEPFATSIPDGGAHEKDKVENFLRAEVCSGSLTLEQAQREITEDWYRVYKESVPH